MKPSTLREISSALNSIADGDIVEFTWQGESIKAGAGKPDHLLDGIRYIAGGGSWQVVEHEGSCPG